MKTIRGALVALTTPFRKGKVDFKTFERQIDLQIRSGIQGLVPCGTTGESPTLSHKEHREVIAAAIEAAEGRVPVIAGTGSNSTEEAVELTRFAQEKGADAVLSVVPYYNKPTPEGLYHHFKTIAECSHLPIILYNIPSRCGVGLTPKTTARLNKIPNITGIKEATGSMDQASEIRSLCSIDIYSGDDSLTLPLLSLGACGVISVIANLFPGAVRRMIDAFFEGDIPGAQRWHERMFPLVKALFMETNPIPVKAAMKILRRDSGELRLPLTPMSKDKIKILKDELMKFKMYLEENP